MLISLPFNWASLRWIDKLLPSPKAQDERGGVVIALFRKTTLYTVTLLDSPNSCLVAQLRFSHFPKTGCTPAGYLP